MLFDVVGAGANYCFVFRFVKDLGNPIDVPISYVSAHPNTKNNIILKLANTRGFFLVDTKGKFFNRKKLERMVTFRTNFVSFPSCFWSGEKETKS